MDATVALLSIYFKISENVNRAHGVTPESPVSAAVSKKGNGLSG
jgi:hypothetical protein